MSTFAFETEDQIKNKEFTFYKLVVEGSCLYDEFCEDIYANKTYTKLLFKIITRMGLYTNKEFNLPKKAFNSIKHGKNVVCHEFKEGNLRVYVKIIEPHIFILLGGDKNSQEKDIRKVKRYIEDKCFQEQIVKFQSI